MSTDVQHFRNDPESLRIRKVVQHASDTAFRARVQRAIDTRFGEHGMDLLDSCRQGEGISEQRWRVLSHSTRLASSPAEFQSFARALRVAPRWLATGSGWMNEPPAGWFTFGTHVDRPDLALDFSEALGEDLLPLWERPASVPVRELEPAIG